MIEQMIRPWYEKLLVTPIVARLAYAQRVKPAVVTLLALLFGVLAALSIFSNNQYLACLLLLLSGYCDSLDGSLARYLGQDSPKGAVLDIVFDRVVEFLILFALLGVDPVHRALPAFSMLGATFICVTSFLVVAIFSANQGAKSFHYSAGLIERAEAFLFFIAMILLPAMFSLFAYLYTFLVLYTAARRVYQFLR